MVPAALLTVSAATARRIALEHVSTGQHPGSLTGQPGDRRTLGAGFWGVALGRLLRHGDPGGNERFAVVHAARAGIAHIGQSPAQAGHDLDVLPAEEQALRAIAFANGGHQTIHEGGVAASLGATFLAQRTIIHPGLTGCEQD